METDWYVFAAIGVVMVIDASLTSVSRPAARRYNSDALAASSQLTVQGNLQQWLGDLIHVLDVQVDDDEAELRVVVRYAIRRTQQPVVAEFRRSR